MGYEDQSMLCCGLISSEKTDSSDMDTSWQQNHDLRQIKRLRKNWSTWQELKKSGTKHLQNF